MTLVNCMHFQPIMISTCENECIGYNHFLCWGTCGWPYFPQHTLRARGGGTIFSYLNLYFYTRYLVWGRKKCIRKARGKKPIPYQEPLIRTKPRYATDSRTMHQRIQKTWVDQLKAPAEKVDAHSITGHLRWEAAKDKCGHTVSDALTASLLHQGDGSTQKPSTKTPSKKVTEAEHARTSE